MQVLFTLDYELYGNGTGDVFQHIITPTEKLLDIARRYQIKYTFFFEVVEYWYLKEEWEKGNSMGYTQNPIIAMEQQLQAAYKEGHDIQLHFHPQWINASFEKGKWILNPLNWCLGKYQGTGENSLVSLFQRGKDTLENIIKPIDSAYQCIAIRAGGYNAQPSIEIVKAMREVGLKIDSSIYPGGLEKGSLSDYDYTSISPTLGHWFVKNSLEEAAPETSDIIEIPIVAFPIKRFQKYLSFDRIKALLQNRKSAADTYSAKTARRKGFLNKIRFFLEKECQTWDFCLFSTHLHNLFIRQIKQQQRQEIVLVGHPKSYVSNNSFEYLLKALCSVHESITITEWHQRILSEKNKRELHTK